MCGSEDPLLTPLLPLARVPFQTKESVHKTPFSNLEILASAASIFTQILAHKPPNLEVFSSQAPKIGIFQLTSVKPPNLEIFRSQAPPPPPPFQRQISVRKPHTSEIRAAHPYLKKIECPPPGSTILWHALVIWLPSTFQIPWTWLKILQEIMQKRCKFAKCENIC